MPGVPVQEKVSNVVGVGWGDSFNNCAQHSLSTVQPVKVPGAKISRNDYGIWL